jgi:hypothetical protein
MFYIDDKKDETSNYNYSGYRGESLSNQRLGVVGVAGAASSYTNNELEGNLIFSPISTEESDFKGCRKKCKSELGHGGGFLFFGGGGKTGRKAFRHCNRTCKSAGGAAAQRDQVITDDLMDSLDTTQAGVGDTNPVVWVMVFVIIAALFAGGYMLLKKKK